MKITLYHYWRSSASWRVRWALELKGIAYESIAIDLITHEEKKADYLKKNPSGYLPTLVADGQILAESVAIIEWLEECFPEKPLLPKEPYKRALARRLAETINSGTQPLQNLDVMRKFSTDTEEQKKWTQYWIKRGLVVYETLLNDFDYSQFSFSMGNTPSYPDFFLIPQVYGAHRFQLDPESFPHCQKIYENALATQECQLSHPDRFKPI